MHSTTQAKASMRTNVAKGNQVNVGDSMLHDAAEKLLCFAKRNPAAELLATRMLNSISEYVLPTLNENPTRIQKLAGVTDATLSEELLTLVRIESARNKAEQERIERRLNATKAFYKRIEENGGLYKVGEVANMTGLSRQALNNQRSKGKILAIQNGHDYFYPGFQFDNGKKLQQLESLLSLMPDDISDAAKIGFFLAEIDLPDGKRRTPADALKDASHKSEVINYLKTKASEFSRHVAP